jgi:UDP-N-acetylmuramoyl-tripeptide--D-alanyl-D-alanine ligase
MTLLWAADDLVAATGGVLSVPFAAAGVSIDTRTLAPGDLFVALTGENGDGHRFVADALAKGAAGAMVHQDVPGAGPLLRVRDTLAALARLGGFARQRFAGRVVAVTGSVGKTTTKEMLRCILSARGTTHAAVASYNNHWGVPLTLARLPHDAAFCVVEIGMNHAGEIAPLARLAAPHVAVVTAVEKAHIGFLGSLEAIADEKASILHGLTPGGVAVLPADSPMLPRLLAVADAAGARVVRFGADAAADVRLVDLALDADGSDVVAQIGGETLQFRLHAPGRHMAMNALAAIAASVHLAREAGEVEARSVEAEVRNAGALRPSPGVASLADLSRAAGEELSTHFTPLSGRGARRTIPLRNGTALLLDESYNGNGASIRAALAVLRLQPAARRIAILGDMLELGDAGAAEHAALARHAAAAADLVFTAGPLMRHLSDALPPARRGAHAADSAALIPHVLTAVAPGDAILVKGSLGSRMRRIVDALEAAHAAEAVA